jgi:hypothetical protein
MRAQVLVVLSLAAPQVQAAGLVVTDPVQSTLTKLQIAGQEKHNAFMKMQMVQDAVIIKNNYLASKAFYDQIDAQSKHRGGLMGYYKEMIEQQFDNVAQSQWRQFQDEATNVTGENSVNTFLNKTSAKISDGAGRGIDAAGNATMAPLNSLDSGYSSVRGALFQQQKRQVDAVDMRTTASDKIAEPIEKEIKSLVRRASVPAISTKELESIQMHANLTQLQLMAEIRQLLSLNSQQINAQTKKDLAEMTMALKASNDLAMYGSARKATPKMSSDEIVRELKRRPGE